MNSSNTQAYQAIALDHKLQIKFITHTQYLFQLITTIDCTLFRGIDFEDRNLGRANTNLTQRWR